MAPVFWRATGATFLVVNAATRAATPKAQQSTALFAEEIVGTLRTAWMLILF